MTHRKTWALAGLALATMAGAALAQQATPPPRTEGGRGGGAERMFREFDANNDGRVTADELRARVAQRFGAADADRDGALTPQEFANLMPRRGGPGGGQAGGQTGDLQQGERMQRFAAMRFRMVDANADGRVTLDELQASAGTMFRGLDANADGAVSRDELPRRGGHRGGPQGPGGAPAPG